MLKEIRNLILMKSDEGVGDNDDKSSSSSQYEVDETERLKRIEAEIEKENKLKRKRRQEKDDDLYIPSPDEVQDSQTPPSGGRKKTCARKSVVSPRAARKKLILRLPKRTPKTKSSQPPSPPPEPSPPKSPHQSYPKQPTPPRQPTPPQSPFHLSLLHQSPPHMSPPHQTPIQEQPVLTSQQIFQTPLSTQPHIQTTLGSSRFRNFPNVPTNMNIGLEDIGDFNFASDDQVKSLEKKVEDVVVENKKLIDREKILEMRFKKSEIDIMKVKIDELEEEKARRDDQNKYFELKNKELEAVKAVKEHEMYMMNKIEVEEVRAKRQAEIDAEMKFKGKGVEGSESAERSLVPSTVIESPIPNPRPTSAVSAIFEEDVLLDDVIDGEDDDEEDDDEEDDEEDKVDDQDDVISASSHSDDDNDNDNQGGTGVKVTEASNEQNVDDYMHDDANEDHESAEGAAEHSEIEEGEIRHTYTMAEIIELTKIDDPDFKFDFEEELKAFDINQPPEYEYKYVDEVDNYDRVEVEDCTDEESVNEDTSEFPTQLLNV
ncbi:hypothetical protein Hanom_Chr17g01591201 [Helianthus anomalus]